MYVYTNKLLKALSIPKRVELFGHIHNFLMKCSADETFDWKEEEEMSKRYDWFFEIKSPYKRVIAHSAYTVENCEKWV